METKMKKKPVKKQPVEKTLDLTKFKLVKLNEHVTVEIYEDRVYIENNLSNQGLALLKSTLKDVYKLVKK
jgi:hypothetical protein